jgi:hypothetical protein
VKIVLCLAAVVLVGCSEAPSKPLRTKENRQAAAESALAKTPVPRSYRFEGSELKIIEVPVKDGSGFVDSQRCFVWRDAEFKSSALSCGSVPDLVVGDPHADSTR